MSTSYVNPYYNPEPYIPASSSEIYDFLASLVGGAPTFIDKSGFFPGQNIDTAFYALTEGFGKVRKKVGEERYAALMELAVRAKALFAEDQAEDNGKTGQGIALIYEIEDIIQSVRSKRGKVQEKDQNGDISGD